MTNEERQEHVIELALELDTTVIQAPNMPGMMFVEYEPPLIEGPTILTQSDYLTMLHEFGHVAHGHTQGRPPFTDKRHYFENGVLRSEAEAWKWAIDRCEEEIEDHTRRFMWGYCLGSYYAHSVYGRHRTDNVLGNGNRHWVKFCFDTPDEFFWSVAEEIAGTAIALPAEHGRFRRRQEDYLLTV